jgi:hypothetical protein
MSIKFCKHIKPMLMFTVLFVMMLSSIAAQTSPASDSSSKQILPSGKWTIAFHPYLSLNYLDSPVTLYSVSSTNGNVTRFSIYNISSKKVVGVRVKWLVHENQERTILLTEGETSLLRFAKGLPSGGSGYIKHEVISFAKFVRPFVLNGRVDKQFDVDLVIDKVLYEDGSVWELNQGPSPDIVRELAARIVTTSDCARQKCVGAESSEVKGGVTYSCGASTLNERCSVSSNSSCTSTSCAAGGGGDEIILE